MQVSCRVNGSEVTLEGHPMARLLDVLRSDLRLTGIYGVEGLDIIEWSRHLRPETRVVLLTGNGTPEIEAEARRLGVDAFIYKPKPLPELAQIVFALLGRES